MENIEKEDFEIILDKVWQRANPALNVRKRPRLAFTVSKNKAKFVFTNALMHVFFKTSANLINSMTLEITIEIDGAGKKWGTVKYKTTPKKDETFLAAHK